MVCCLLSVVRGPLFVVAAVGRFLRGSSPAAASTTHESPLTTAADRQDLPIQSRMGATPNVQSPPSLPPELAQYQPLLDKLVEKDRDARFRNADEVIGFLARKFEQQPAAH